MSKRNLSPREKLEANDEKARRHAMARGLCFHCGKYVSLADCHLAHKIPAYEMYIEKYGEAVIYHELNMDITCSDCNIKSSLNPKSHPIEAGELVDEINIILKDNIDGR